MWKVVKEKKEMSGCQTRMRQENRNKMKLCVERGEREKGDEWMCDSVGCVLI